MSALAATGITKRFGGILALDNASLHVAAGSCHALMGENGAGKSTFAKILAGLFPADTGHIELFGERVHLDSPNAAMAAGIAIVHQELLFCENLTVAENLALHDMPRHGPWVDFAAMAESASEWLAPIGPEIDPRAIVGELSAGQQQIIQIAGAIGRGARLVVFDEPTSSLSQGELARFFEICDNLRAEGVTCIFVSHRLPEIFRLCDSVTVLRDGCTIHEGKLDGMTEGELVRWMVGRNIEAAEEIGYHPGEVLLEMQDFRVEAREPAVALSVRAGEVVGLAGLVGSGRSELAEALIGLRPAAGSVQVQQKALELGDIESSMSAGLGLVPEDRKRQGLSMNLNVRENMALATLARRQKLSWVAQRAEVDVCETIRQQLGIKTESLEVMIGTLSGGNQQKVVLGKWLLTDSKVLILDEPTRGVDVAAKAEIHRHIRAIAESGRGILLISSELPELLLLSDRILVMREGAIVGKTTRADATEEKLIRWMTGVEEQHDMGMGTRNNI